MDRLVAIAVNRRYLMVALFAIVFIGGLLAFQQLNIEAYPDPTPPMVDIVTQSPGLSGRGDRALHHDPDRDPGRRHQEPEDHPYYLAVRPLRRQTAVLVRLHL
ncbi:hypothetical protein ACVMB0_004187 [Bradyrhizobium sp. USDA 4451]